MKKIDLSNGNVYTGFQKFWKNVKGGQFDFSKYIKGKWKDFTGYLGGKVDELKDLGKKIGKPFKDGYEIIKNKTKDIRENVKIGLERRKNLQKKS